VSRSAYGVRSGTENLASYASGREANPQGVTISILQSSTLGDQAQFVKAGWYGDVGTTKTTSLATLAKFGKILYIDSEAGLEKGPLQDLDIPVDNIVPFRDITYDALDALHWDLRSELASDPNAIVGVCFDSMTEIVAKLVEQTNDVEIERQIRKAERRGEDTSALSKFRIDLGSWGVVTEQVRRLLRRYRDLPCHMGWSALERRDVDQNDGTVNYGPKVNPGLQGDLVGYVGVVLHTWVDGEDADGNEMFVAHTRKTPKYTAKDRFHATPKRLAVPSFERVIGYVEKTLVVAEDPIQQHYHNVLTERRNRIKAPAEAA
jgi:hypothetical protein